MDECYWLRKWHNSYNKGCTLVLACCGMLQRPESLGTHETACCYQPNLVVGHFVMAFANKTDTCVCVDSTQNCVHENLASRFFVCNLYRVLFTTLHQHFEYCTSASGVRGVM